ncbi:hypothetical protein [Actinomadura fibrosa]|uniref:Secreted protein n=1 Tax=Actinomadura fibrosa TaxID=111802 RepID=A0ABW2XU98_9ACTN|nr:hypothetical protein [Actinomadura fibrosa]
MKAPTRFLSVIGIACALLPAAAATSYAAPPKEADCVTATETQDYGRGEISLCPQGDGTYHITGWIEDLLPGDGVFTGPDGACVAWYLYAGTEYVGFPPSACPHFHGPTNPAKLQLDVIYKSDAPLTSAKLGRYWV